MSKRKYPPEVREQAIAIAAGQSSSAAADQLDVNPRTVRHWVHGTDPATIAQYVQQKRAVAQRVVLERTEAAVTKLMSQLAGEDELDHYQAKALQAQATALGILDDHYGGRQAPGAAGRFGTNSLLDGWTEGDRVTLERIERLTLDRGTPPPQSEG